MLNGSAVSVSAMLTKNIIPVTLGNIIGGTVLVSANGLNRSFQSLRKDAEPTLPAEPPAIFVMPISRYAPRSGVERTDKPHRARAQIAAVYWYSHGDHNLF